MQLPLHHANMTTWQHVQNQKDQHLYQGKGYPFTLSSIPACTRGHMTRWGLCPVGIFVQGIIVQRGSLSRGVSVQGGLCSVQGGSVKQGLCLGVSVRKTSLYSNERAVHILLEYILVACVFHLGKRWVSLFVVTILGNVNECFSIGQS